jgi:hypothetical protein
LRCGIRSILLTCTSYKGLLRAHKQHIKDITVSEFTWNSLQKRNIAKDLPTAISACSAKYILVHYDAQIIEKFHTIKNDTSQYVGKLNRMAQSWKSDRFTLNSFSYEFCSCAFSRTRTKNVSFRLVLDFSLNLQTD